MVFSQSQAQEIALSALLHVVAEPELVSAFLASSGLQPADLRGMAHTPELGLHVLDFLLEHDSRVIAAAAALEIAPQQLMAARVALAGPGSFGWEVD